MPEKIPDLTEYLKYGYAGLFIACLILACIFKGWPGKIICIFAGLILLALLIFGNQPIVAFFSIKIETVRIYPPDSEPASDSSTSSTDAPYLVLNNDGDIEQIHLNYLYKTTTIGEKPTYEECAKIILHNPNWYKAITFEETPAPPQGNISLIRVISNPLLINGCIYISPHCPDPQLSAVLRDFAGKKVTLSMDFSNSNFIKNMNLSGKKREIALTPLLLQPIPVNIAVNDPCLVIGKDTMESIITMLRAPFKIPEDINGDKVDQVGPGATDAKMPSDFFYETRVTYDFKK